MVTTSRRPGVQVNDPAAGQSCRAALLIDGRIHARDVGKIQVVSHTLSHYLININPRNWLTRSTSSKLIENSENVDDRLTLR